MAAIYTNFRLWLAGLLGAHQSSSENVEDQVDGMREFTVGYFKAAADAMASTTTASQKFWRAPRDCQVIHAAFVTNTAVAADASDGAGIVLNKHDGAGGAATALGTYSTLSGGQGAIADGVPAAIPLSTTLATVQLAAGNVLAFEITKAASGKVVGVGNLVVQVRYI